MSEVIPRNEFFTPGNIVTSFGGQDLVLVYTEEGRDKRWSVLVVSVEKNEYGRWARSGYPRYHTTEPDRFSKILDRNIQA